MLACEDLLSILRLAILARQPSLVRMSQEARARALAARDRACQGRSEREILQASALARLHAKLQTLPEIEQAKGIIMGQQLCGPDEAFDLLRRASQRANVKVKVMAAQLVEQVSAGSRGDAAIPVSPRQSAQQPCVPVRGGASVHEHAAAVHDQAAAMHEGAAAFFNEHDRADKAKRERSLAEDERARAAEAREAAMTADMAKTRPDDDEDDQQGPSRVRRVRRESAVPPGLVAC